ncbi:hypothetical protein BB560_006992 [Smittium megazygosporum]|uniref:Yeast cell wall synthesis Kre9/Knh1-like N-terminal domain-containing protein n=1 Tax=Smittium megazygosporum TaxID=133381 RepID=A0A2T9XZJ2_9FUNG|nr:hypothetical protein BB560_006992 [Smittium megazygosporum]
MILKLLTIIGYLLSVVLGKLYIIDPVQGAVWNAGKNEKISWTLDNNSTKSEKVKIELLAGDPNNLSMVGKLTDSADMLYGEASVKVPSDVANGESYVIRITEPDKSMRYSHAFAITGGKNAGPGSGSDRANSASMVSGSSTASSDTMSSYALSFQRPGGFSLCLAAVLMLVVSTLA